MNNISNWLVNVNICETTTIKLVNVKYNSNQQHMQKY